MNKIELYSNEILDIIELEQEASTFNENVGDYIKMEVIDIESKIVRYNSSEQISESGDIVH